MTHEFTTYLNVCVIMLAIILFLFLSQDNNCCIHPDHLSAICVSIKGFTFYLIFKLKCKSGCVKWSVNKLANIDLSKKRYIMIRLCTLQWSQFSYIPLTKKARWIKHTLGRLSKVFSLLLSYTSPTLDGAPH